MASDIKLAAETLADRHDLYTNAEDYYRGSEREVFASSKWNKALKTRGLDYVLNFSKTVVDTVLDRLEIAGIKGTSPEADAALNIIWEQNELTLDATEIHRRALVFGDCYAIVWPDEEGEVQITYNSPLTTVLLYDDENPRKKRVAVKMWQTTNSFDKKVVRMNVFYADRVEKFWRAGELMTANGGDENTWNHTETVENPWGELPVFHFRTHRPYGTPEHAAAIGPQDAINKLVMNHMETVDYQGAPQRYALSNFGNTSEFTDFDNDDTARENVGGLQSGPGQLWYLDGVNQVGQFSAADHKQFTEPIMAYVKSMASLTQTPLHYFQNNGQFASGEALRTAEAPLTKKCRERQISFGSTWRDVFRFALKIMGIVSDVQVNWSGIESMDSQDSWNIAQIKLAAGIPMKIVLTEMGYDSEVADEIVKAAEEEAKRKAKLNLTAPGADNTAALGAGMNSHNLAVQAAAAQRKASDGDPATN